MKRALPLLLAAAAALPVGVITTNIDSRYEATASTRLQILFGPEELAALRNLAGLPSVTEPAKSLLLPVGVASLDRIEARSARRLRSTTPFEAGDVRVIDTAAELGTTKFNEPMRRLKVKAAAEDPHQAARLANVYLAEYLRERDRSSDRVFAETRAALAARSTPTLSRITGAARSELVEAADIALDLNGGVVSYDAAPAVAPQDRISPRPVRDTVVAGILGALIGWLFGYVRAAASRSKSSRFRSTIASRP